MSAAKKGRICTKEHKAKISAARKGKYVGIKSPLFGRTGVITGNWKGGISFALYCIKFNKVYKNHIRNLFGNECFLCGKTQAEDGRALAVHHVDYNKQCGCDGSTCICVPLCRACHSKTGADRDYWQALITEMLKPVEAWSL